MQKKIKLIWDFRGEDALATAKHHTIHLKEFSVLEGLDFFDINTTVTNPMLAAAYIIIKAEDLQLFKDRLKPHRGEIAD